MDKKLKKLWHFIWEDDSAASWIVNILLAFVLIKFIVYPVLGFLLQTSFPIVAVVSSSMEHTGNFEEWWSSNAICASQQCSQGEFYSIYGITKDDFKKFKFKNGFNKGDIMVLYGSGSGDLKVGDVLVFKASRPDPIIHRIIKKTNTVDGYVFQTKGDHNSRSIAASDLNEMSIYDNQLVGKAVFRLPYLGYVKIWAVDLLNLFRGR
jgi:signal peptidase I